MLKHLKSPVLWGLVLWFYLGIAYLTWSIGTWAPLPSGPPRPHLVSAEMDPIIGSFVILGPLILLCGLPVYGVSQLLLFIANSATSLWHGTSYSLPDVMHLSPLLTALIIYRIYLPIHHRWQSSVDDFPYH
jgi:hypothetical protein